VNSEPVVRTFTHRLADEKPRAVRGEDVGLRALRMQVEASGWLVDNLDALRPRVERRADGLYVVIENVATVPNPAWDEPCRYCP